MDRPGRARAAEFDPALLNVAFVFLLLGYGTKVGLAPLHAWLPDAHAEGPTPISAVLSGLLLNVALYALLRFKMLLAVNPAALAPGPLMVTMGLISLIFAAFMLYRRRDIKRMFAYSSIEHMGIITFAFGMGGPLANFAGLLHMTMHSLTKSAIFFAVGHIAQVKGTQQIADMGGLTETNPVLGWGLVLGVVAIAGLPPLGIFMSEFLVVSSTFAREPWLAILLVFGILVGFGALFLRLNTIAFGEPRGPTRRGEGLLCADVRASRAGVRRRHLPAAGAGGLVPERGEAARIDRMATLRDTIAQGRQGGRAPPLAARRRDADGWRAIAAELAAGRCDAARPVGRRRRRAHGGARRSRPRSRSSTIECPDGQFPSVGALHPPAIRLERAIHDLYRLGAASARRTRGPGSISASGTCSIRSATAATRRRRARPMRSCRPRARACTRFRSGRCMPASSSPAISASPPTARPWCGSSSASATCTRASSR